MLDTADNVNSYRAARGNATDAVGPYQKDTFTRGIGSLVGVCVACMRPPKASRAADHAFVKAANPRRAR